MKLSNALFLLAVVALTAVIGLNVSAQQLRASSDDASGRRDFAMSRMTQREATTYEQLSLLAGVVLLGSIGGGFLLRRKEAGSAAKPRS